MPRRKPSDRAPDATERETPEQPTAAPVSVAGTLRIIGGTNRGRLIRYTGDPRTRPMKDRVREAVFNLLGPDVKQKHVVDLFAGTGALGLEALSRGSLAATFFERHFPTADGISENIRALGLEACCQVIPANTLVQFRKPAPFVTPDPVIPWLVFCSPPYDLYVQQEEDLLRLLTTIVTRAPQESCVVVESDVRFDLSHLPDAEAWRTRDYDPAIVSIWRKTSPEE